MALLVFHKDCLSKNSTSYAYILHILVTSYGILKFQKQPLSVISRKFLGYFYKIVGSTEKYLCLCFGKIPGHKWRKGVQQNNFLDRLFLQNTTQQWILKLKISYKGATVGFLDIASNLAKIEHGDCYFSNILDIISRKFILSNKFIEHLLAGASKVIFNCTTCTLRQLS